MNKDILKLIYKNVKNNSKTDKNPYPRIIDYVNAVIEYEDANFYKKASKDELHKRQESIRRSVTNALNVLVKEKILDNIENRYVPIEQKLEHDARLYLLKNLHSTRKYVLKLSKKVCVLPLDKEAYFQKIPQITSCNCSNSAVSRDIETLSPEIQELKEEIVNLEQEVRQLKEAIRKRNEEVKLYDDIIFNLRMFISDQYCYDIYKTENTIVIMFDLSEDDKKNKKDEELRKKLNLLLIDIEKAKSKFSLKKTTKN